MDITSDDATEFTKLNDGVVQPSRTIGIALFIIGTLLTPFFVTYKGPV